MEETLSEPSYRVALQWGGIRCGPMVTILDL